MGDGVGLGVGEPGSGVGLMAGLLVGPGEAQFR
mgnify:CR=1 FL=1